MNLEQFSTRAGEWLSGEGPHCDVVISSRIRLARNLADHLFLSRADDRQKELITEEIHEALDALEDHLDLKLVDVDSLESIDRLVLLERHLISRHRPDCRPG